MIPGLMEMGNKTAINYITLQQVFESVLVNTVRTGAHSNVVFQI